MAASAWLHHIAVVPPSRLSSLAGGWMLTFGSVMAVESGCSVGGMRRVWAAVVMAGRRDRFAAVKDLLLGVGLALMVVVERSSQDASRWELFVGSVGIGVAVVAYRAFPLLSLFVVVALELVQIGMQVVSEGRAFPLSYVVAVFVMSYLLGRDMADVRPAVSSICAIFAAATVLTLALAGDVGWWALAVVLLLFTVVFPWLIGRYWRHYQQLVHAGWELAERLEREKRIIADRERLRERARIAHDMHDSLGHELSLIAVRAGALEVASGLDERHRTAGRQLRESAAEATDRLREIISVLRDDALRDDAGATRLAPARESIPQLVERANASGLRVELHQDGAAALSPMADRAAYRVVQEALTNAIKHAPGAAVTVRLAGSVTETTVTVANERPEKEPAPESPSGNVGLIGLRERIRLAGGVLHAGPRDGGGFEVVARLPHVSPGAVRPVSDDETESAVQLAGAQRRVRRGLVTAIVVPVSITVAVVVLSAAYYVIGTWNSVLKPAAFERLRIGQPSAEVERALPVFDDIGPPSRDVPPAPAGATCRFFRAHGNVLRPADTYRLCFTNGRLVAKDVIARRTADDRTGGRKQ